MPPKKEAVIIEMLRRISILLFVLLLALSCREPRSTETFVRGTGPYVFTVEMADSTATYDFDLYTRIDAATAPAELPLKVAWKAPDGTLFTESVYLPVSGNSSFFSHEAYAPYRSAVVPSQWGTWTVTVTLLSVPEGLRGMGLVVRRVSQDADDS